MIADDRRAAVVAGDRTYLVACAGVRVQVQEIALPEVRKSECLRVQPAAWPALRAAIDEEVRAGAPS